MEEHQQESLVAQIAQIMAKPTGMMFNVKKFITYASRKESKSRTVRCTRNADTFSVCIFVGGGKGISTCGCEIIAGCHHNLAGRKSTGITASLIVRT